MTPSTLTAWSKKMTRYFVEYSDDFGMTKRNMLDSRDKAMASARYRSEKTSAIVYVLDEDRTGHIAFANGVIDHKEGDAI